MYITPVYLSTVPPLPVPLLIRLHNEFISANNLPLVISSYRR
uniref:Uncharacterized protein n=1 Tax=Anguilla anguilla TaxID=7936 RepID=A0A0E9QX54_ANGAN